jgi:hypothetical protein
MKVNTTPKRTKLDPEQGKFFMKISNHNPRQKPNLRPQSGKTIQSTYNPSENSSRSTVNNNYQNFSRHSQNLTSQGTYMSKGRPCKPSRECSPMNLKLDKYSTKRLSTKMTRDLSNIFEEKLISDYGKMADSPNYKQRNLSRVKKLNRFIEKGSENSSLYLDKSFFEGEIERSVFDQNLKPAQARKKGEDHLTDCSVIRVGSGVNAKINKSIVRLREKFWSSVDKTQPENNVYKNFIISQERELQA